MHFFRDNSLLNGVYTNNLKNWFFILIRNGICSLVLSYKYLYYSQRQSKQTSAISDSPKTNSSGCLCIIDLNRHSIRL